MLHLECSHCHSTPKVEEWNKQIKNSMFLGLAEEEIPEDLSSDELEEYMIEKPFSVDCPECGERCESSDMAIY